MAWSGPSDMLGVPMPSMLETNRYHSARRFLLEGRREWVLMIAGELLRSISGRELALSLLAELYPEAPAAKGPGAESSRRVRVRSGTDSASTGA